MITIEEFKKKQSAKIRIIGLDLGTKRIGVSICDENQSIATPFKTLIKKDTKQFINEIKEIVDENDVKAIIIGNPINMDGSIGAKSQSSRSFIRNLSKELNIPILLWDERLTTVSAERSLLEADISRKKRQQIIDKIAASIILQNFLDYLNTKQ